MKNYKRDFPILQRKIGRKTLVYLDSASTSQKPKQVIDSVSHFYETSNANIHRGIYTISEEETVLFEGAREKVAAFINAKSPSEIVFTRNTTEALNIIAYGLGKNIHKGDAILISEMEHHSNIVPWQRVAKERNAKLYYWKISDEGVLLDEDVGRIQNLKIVSLSHVSNVLGTINPLEKIVRKIRSKKPGLTIVIDAAQSVPHMPVDVKRIDCDFLAFSGHKMLAPSGVGVLFGKEKLLTKMEPLLVGSHMISEVTMGDAVWADLPAKFEPGTAPIEAVVGLGSAIDYLNEVGMDIVRNHELRITDYALTRMAKIDRLTLYGPRDAKQRGGVIAFNVQGIHPHDVAQILSEDAICVRSGHHCAMPLHKKLEVEASVRASFYIYNDEADVDKLMGGIEKVKKTFKVKQNVVYERVSKKGRKFIIRYPRKGDLNELHKYINSLSLEKTFISFQGERVTLSEERNYLSDQLRRMKSKRGILFVVEINGIICGASGVEMNERGMDHVGVFGLSLSKDVRGEGIGKQVMSVVLKHAKQLPKLRLLTLTIYANNDVGTKLYEFFGFKTFGRLPKGFRYKNTFVDSIQMYKEMEHG
jgi:cysteine desulfurase/selenocysteine lyase